MLKFVKTKKIFSFWEDLNMDINEIIEMKYKKAKVAQKEWRSLIHITKPKPNDRIVLFPTDDYECNLQGMRYLDTYLQRENADKAIIITIENNVKREIQGLSDNIKTIIEISREQADNLISLYELHIFDERFVVVSLDKPISRNGSNIIGYKGTTVEQVVAIGIYGIIPFRQLPESKKII